MKLCGFEASTGSSTVDQFDGLNAIFCHKYDSSVKRTVNLFNAKGGNTPGLVNTVDYGGDGSGGTLYLGHGDCDEDVDCYDSLLCGHRDDGEGILGLYVGGGPSD